MYLYDKKGNNIDIYSFEPTKKDLVEYRARLLQQKDPKDLFYKFETTSKTITNRFLNGDELDFHSIQKEDKSSDCSDWWAQLGKDTYDCTYPYKSKKVEQQELIQKYINGDFSTIIPTRIFEFIPQDDSADYINNFLVTTPPTEIYSNVEKRKYYSLENIIDLPTKLCTLQLLQNGRFKQVLYNNLDFQEQLELFKIKRLNTVSVKEMEKMFKYGLLTGTYDEVLKNISDTQKILARKK